MKGLSDIPGIKVGHASDFEGLTGCTAILCESGATGGVYVSGAATGTEELDVLSPGHVTPHVHGICLSGGSAFGLEATSGVRRVLERKGVGYKTRAGTVPIVAGAILYDLDIGKPNVRPTREMGELAAVSASADAVKEGCIGAGTGARAGLVNGFASAMKSGLGSYTVELPGSVLVSALAAVNAFGSVIDPRTGKVIAGARVSPESKDFADPAQILKARAGKTDYGQNTVLVVVATNARLNKVQCSRLAQLANHGLIRSVAPITVYDGDVVFALSSGSLVADFVGLGVAAAEAVSEAVLRAVRLARPLGGLPALGS